MDVQSEEGVVFGKDVNIWGESYHILVQCPSPLPFFKEKLYLLLLNLVHESMKLSCICLMLYVFKLIFVHFQKKITHEKSLVDRT